MQFRGVKVVLRDGLEPTEQLRQDVYTAWVDLQNLHRTQPGLQYKAATSKKGWQVSSMNGVDQIKILGYYDQVIPKKIKPKISKRRQIIYYPAWDAFDQNDVHIGYVIAKGGGWKPPYEFIEKTNYDTTDPFEWGQWLENYSTPPYINFETYVEPNIILRQPNFEYNEIPPRGTKNRMFEARTYTEQSNVQVCDTPVCDPCCIQQTEGFIDALYIIYAFSKTEIDKYKSNFTYGAAGEDGDEPPDHPTVANKFAAWDTVYNFGIEERDNLNTATGILREYHDWGRGWLGNNYLINASLPVTCAGVWVYRFGTLVAGCVTMVANHVEPYLAAANSRWFDDESIAIWNVSGRWYFAYQYDVDVSSQSIDNHWYHTRFSSVEVDDKFAIIYDNWNTDSTRKADRTTSFCFGTDPFAESFTVPEIPLTIIHTYRVDVCVSKSVVTIGNYTVSDSDYISDFWIRYYRVGAMEVMLGAVKQMIDDYWVEFKLRWIHVLKRGGTATKEDSIILTSVGGKVEIPDVVDKYGQVMYMKKSFRLIKYERIIIEEVF